jgi:3-deoxy-7-phosphoheptulonate synthase
MHGNTETVSGFKTRRYENIRAEIEAFFDVHQQMGTVPGGVHLEMTGGWGKRAGLAKVKPEQ